MIRLITWLFDLLIIMMILRAVSRLFSGTRSSAPSQPRQRAASQKPVERIGGTLVRDPQCGTYIPESSAIRAGTGENAVFFCSTACRDAYVRQAKGA